MARAEGQLPSNDRDINNTGEYHLTMCLFYSDENQYDSAFWHAESAIASFRNNKDSIGLIDVYHELSLINLDMSIYEEAITYNQLAFDLASAVKDTARIVHHMKDFAIIYHGASQFDQGLDFANKGYELALRASEISSPELADVLNSLATNYEGKRDLESALKYHFLAHKTFEGLNSTPTFQDSIKLVKVKNSIGKTYLNLNLIQEAKQWLMEAYRLNTLLRDNFEFADNMTNLGLVYSNIDQYDSAEFYLKKAQKFATESGNIEKLITIYKSLIRACQNKGDIDCALFYQDKYTLLQDSVAGIKKKRAHSVIETRFQINQKQQQIKLQNAELRDQETQLKINVLIIVGLSLFVILLAVLFFFWKYKLGNKQQEALRTQEAELNEQQATAVINSLENERMRIARDIHDGLGQSISALGLNIHSLNNTDNSKEVRAKTYDNSQLILDNLHEEIRNIAFTLMPHTLMQAGIIGALNELIIRINESEMVSASLNTFDIPQKLGEKIELSLFRIIQELLSNIIKYANAGKIEIQLTGYPHELLVLIEDDGDGYNLNDFKHSKGNGWNNINYRLNLIKASIEFDTMKGKKGSTVTIEIPM